MLTTGICSIVYGSSEIASVRYFKQNELGCVIEDESDLYPRIRELIDSKQLREKYINAALKQAERFHNAKENARAMNRVIVSCVEKFEREKE